MSADYTAEQQQDSEEPLHKTQGPYILLQAKLDMTEYNDLVADAYALPSVGGLPPPARNTMEHNMRHITAQCLACHRAALSFPTASCAHSGALLAGHVTNLII